MSRIPQSSSTRSPAKSQSRSLVPPSTRTSTRSTSPLSPGISLTTPTPRVRTKSVPKHPPKSPAKAPAPLKDDRPKTHVSIRDAIALKRAEAKTVQSTRSGLDNLLSLEDALPSTKHSEEISTDNDLGRWSVRETIERGRSTGSINLSTRSLQCLPSALFEIHLGITPDSLKFVPNEPPLPAPSLSAAATSRRGGQSTTPAWFEAQDLQVLKAWSNEIIEIQHEISLFGSLKIVDLHNNKLVTLPTSFADLTSLTNLDISHNALISLPFDIFALPNLTVLDISHNSLTGLPFDAPFSGGSTLSSRPSYGNSFFTPTITRASAPLPRLISFSASNNKLTSSSIAHQAVPASLSKINLSANPLGGCRSLIHALGRLENLTEVRLESAEIGDESFPSDLFTSIPFPNLRLLDIGETRVTATAIKDALKGMKQVLTLEMTTADPPQGVCKVLVGKKVIKESWEVETERKAKIREARGATNVGTAKIGDGQETTRSEQGPLKEQWELEAESGILTEGGRRRERAAASLQAQAQAHPESASPPMAASNPRTPNISLSNPRYFSAATQTLTLPSSLPPIKNHTRAVSHASSSWNLSEAQASKFDLALPTPTLPLALISAQPFARTLTVLILANRRMDVSFSLPSLSDESSLGSLLPQLEELSLEGCRLGDAVSISQQSAESEPVPPPRVSSPLLPFLVKSFPSVRTLNLSYNTLTSASLTPEVLSQLILADAPSEEVRSQLRRPGLRHLRLRGNRLTELDGLQHVAAMFRGNRDIPRWKLEELDLRDNEIGKLPAELGLLPLDVFLVDGNLFRVPQRRVWEREGTKGLLSWLRSRLE